MKRAKFIILWAVIFFVATMIVGSAVLPVISKIEGWSFPVMPMGTAMVWAVIAVGSPLIALSLGSRGILPGTQKDEIKAKAEAFKMKRVLMIAVWTAGAYFGGETILAMLWGLLAGVIGAVCYGLHYDLRDYLTAHHSILVMFGIIFRILGGLVAVAVLILALRGRLPGTTIGHDSSARREG